MNLHSSAGTQTKNKYTDYSVNKMISDYEKCYNENRILGQRVIGAGGDFISRASLGVCLSHLTLSLSFGFTLILISSILTLLFM